MSEKYPAGLDRPTPDYGAMDWQDFQKLANELLFLLSIRDPEKYKCDTFLPAMSEGQDGGCDGFHIGLMETTETDRHGRWNVQVKRYENHKEFTAAKLAETIEKTKQLSKRPGMSPDGLLIVIACSVPKNIQTKWEDKIRASGLKPAVIWDKDKLDLLIKNYAPDIMFGPGRVFYSVSHWRPHSFLMEDNDNFFKEPLVGRITALERLKEYSEATNPQKLAVVVGPEGAGKTHVVYKWAEKHSVDNLAREDRANASPIWPVAIGQTWRTSLAAHFDELDPTGRQLIIADCRLNEDEWKELERSLHADARAKKVKLVAVASEHELDFIKNTFSSWGDPVEIRVDKLNETEFNDLAMVKGVKEEYLHTVARATNRLPGFLNLALESKLPLHKLSQHNCFSAALRRIEKAIGPGEQDRRACIAALAWASLTQPVTGSNLGDPPAAPEVLNAYIRDKYSWTKAWKLLKKSGIFRKESSHFQIGWRVFPAQLGHAAIEKLFVDFDNDDRFKLFVAAKQTSKQYAIGNIIASCVALREDESIRNTLENFIDLYLKLIPQLEPHDQQFELGLIYPIAQIYPEKVVSLVEHLIREWEAHREEFPSVDDTSLEMTITHERTPLHYIIDSLLPSLERSGLYAKCTRNVMGMLPALEKLGEFSRYETNEQNNSLLRLIINLSGLDDKNECAQRMKAAIIVLEEWSKSSERMERKFAATGLAAATALSWDTTYTLTSRNVVLGTKSIMQEPEWLKPMREEAFHSLLDLVLSDAVELDERESLMKNELWKAHGNILGLWDKESISTARNDLVQLMCDRFIDAMDNASDDMSQIDKKGQIAKYLCSKMEKDWQQHWLGSDETRNKVKDAIGRHLRNDDMKMLALLRGEDMPLIRADSELTCFRDIRGEGNREALKSQIDLFVKRIISSQDSDVKSISKQILIRLEAINRYIHFNVDLFMIGASLAEQLGEKSSTFINDLFSSASPGNALLPDLVAGAILFQLMNGKENANALSIIEEGHENEKRQRSMAFLRAASRMDIAKKLPDNFYEAVCASFEFAPPLEISRLAPFIFCILDRFGFNRRLLANTISSLVETLPEEARWQFFRMIKYDMKDCSDLFLLIKDSIVEKLVCSKMSNDLLQMLSFIFRTDLSGLLAFFEARLRHAVSLGKDLKDYRPFPTSTRLIENIFKSDKYDPDDIRNAPVVVRDWVLLALDFVGYLGGSNMFEWVDWLQSERDSVSGLGIETAKALNEWFVGDLGKYVLHTGEELVGVKRWGAPLLLRAFDFDEKLWTFLFPLIEQGHAPENKGKERRPWEQRLWTELMCAEGTTGAYWPSMERELAREALYRKMESLAPENAKLFFAALVERAKNDIEREALDDDS